MLNKCIKHLFLKKLIMLIHFNALPIEKKSIHGLTCFWKMPVMFNLFFRIDFVIYLSHNNTISPVCFTIRPVYVIVSIPIFYIFILRKFYAKMTFSWADFAVSLPYP